MPTIKYVIRLVNTGQEFSLFTEYHKNKVISTLDRLNISYEVEEIDLIF
jgi:hypothetical protein